MARKKRDRPVSYRPPEKLRGEFLLRVQNSGLPINAFITAAVFNAAPARARRTSPLDARTVALLLSQAARISDRLDAVVATSAQPELLQACRDELSEIRTCLMRALGREP